MVLPCFTEARPCRENQLLNPPEPVFVATGASTPSPAVDSLTCNPFCRNRGVDTQPARELPNLEPVIHRERIVHSPRKDSHSPRKDSTILAPFGSILVPFGPFWFRIGCLWVSLGSPWFSLGSLLVPFRSFVDASDPNSLVFLRNIDISSQSHQQVLGLLHFHHASDSQAGLTRPADRNMVTVLHLGAIGPENQCLGKWWQFCTCTPSGPEIVTVPYFDDIWTLDPGTTRPAARQMVTVLHGNAIGT